MDLCSGDLLVQGQSTTMYSLRVKQVRSYAEEKSDTDLHVPSKKVGQSLKSRNTEQNSICKHGKGCKDIEREVKQNHRKKQENK